MASTPHKVPGFFNPQSILPAYFQEPKHKKSLPKLSDDRPRLGDQTTSVSSIFSPDSHERTSRMPDFHGKKISLYGFQAPKLKSSSKDALNHYVPAKMSITMESPPAVSYGQPSNSTGAIISGQLRLYITESVEITDLSMKFVLETTRKRPFHANCADCSVHSEELRRWNFLIPPKMEKGEHKFPFSYKFKGTQPASMDGPLSKLEYNFHAVMTSKSGEKITLDKTLDLKRAICPSEEPKQSLRIFPPTNLVATLDLPSAIYPIGEATATMRVNGIVRIEEERKVQHHWRLKRLAWKLEETHKMISPACPRHAAKTAAKAGQQAKLDHEHIDVRTIGSGEMRSGWKSDYNSSAGCIEIEFPFSISTNARPTCDVKVEDGIDVYHQMIVELIITEESAPIGRPQQSIETGAARVLRMQFNVIVTERAGLGISWDDEQPPTYENVPPSPPGYRVADVLDYVGSPLTGSQLPPVPEYALLPQ